MQIHTFTHSTNKNLDYLVKNNSQKQAVVLFHGYGASMQDLYDLNQISQQYDWYFPQGTMELMGNMSRAWFPINEQALQAAMMQGTHRDLSKGKPLGLEDNLELTRAFIESLDYEKIIIGGFSQGAMLSSHLLAELSPKLKACILFSGNLISEESLSKKLAEAKNKEVEIFQSHGKSDPILGFDGARKLEGLLKKSGFNIEFHEFQGQHEIPMSVIQSWALFMQRCLL